MCVYEAIYLGPHRLLANTQGGSPSPPPREKRRRESAARLDCRAIKNYKNKNLQSHLVETVILLLNTVTCQLSTLPESFYVHDGGEIIKPLHHCHDPIMVVL
jgi:hypothetical protein